MPDQRSHDQNAAALKQTRHLLDDEMARIGENTSGLDALESEVEDVGPYPIHPMPSDIAPDSMEPRTQEGPEPRIG